METNKPSVYQQTLGRLNENIVNGIWKPGQRIPTMKQLSKKMNVSLTIIREALRTLENQGIVSIEHGRGIYLRNDPNAMASNAAGEKETLSLLSILNARLLVEPEQAYYCAERADSSLCQKLQDLAHRLDQEMQVNDNFLSIDLKFHQLISEGAEQPSLKIMTESLEKYQIESRRMTNTLPQMRTKASLYHQLIAAAITTHNAKEAKQLMTLHIESMIEPLKEVKTDDK
ncbi:GntR family transcriptional regulator [Tetragenococcus halophilus subsp. flandriensis]|nr:GntR family transcriptional regulator [Tetragenococcus halophilus subsp. flandriensis]